MLDAEGHLVLTNFDCAEFLPASANTRGTSSPTVFECGMTQYQAPEILLGWTHNSAVDCWGFGIVLYFLFFGTVSVIYFLKLRVVDLVHHLQYPFGGKKVSEDKTTLRNQIIQFPIPMESRRLVHPTARDLVLQVRIEIFESRPSMNNLS